MFYPHLQDEKTKAQKVKAFAQMAQAGSCRGQAGTCSVVVDSKADSVEPVRMPPPLWPAPVAPGVRYPAQYQYMPLALLTSSNLLPTWTRKCSKRQKVGMGKLEDGWTPKGLEDLVAAVRPWLPP